MLSPLPRRSGWAYYFAHSPQPYQPSRKGCRVGLRIVLFEVCSAFTRVTACTLALSPIRDTLIEGFSHFVASMTAPIASPRLDAASPELLTIFGGRQSARTIHFIAASMLVIFAIVRVFMVLISGVWNNMRSIITGRYWIETRAETDA
jgi:hypothetical protein